MSSLISLIGHDTIKNILLSYIRVLICNDYIWKIIFKLVIAQFRSYFKTCIKRQRHRSPFLDIFCGHIILLASYKKYLSSIFIPVKEARKGFFGCYIVCETMKDTKEGYFIM